MDFHTILVVLGFMPVLAAANDYVYKSTYVYNVASLCLSTSFYVA